MVMTGGGRQSYGTSVRICCLLLILLAIMAAARNETWRTHVTLFEDTVMKSPGKPRPHIGLGNAYLELGMYSMAQAQFETAGNVAILDPTLSVFERGWAIQMAANNVGRVQIEIGNFPEAKRVLEEAWNRYTGNPSIALNLSLVYIQLGEPAKALRASEAGLLALRLKSNFGGYPWFHDIGALYWDHGIANQMLHNCSEADLDFKEAMKREYLLPKAKISECFSL